MKRLILLITFILITFGSSEARDRYNYFYKHLAPHGAWIEFNDGIIGWQPYAAVNRTWQPYTQGAWIWTEDGWFWDSYEPFGAISYHYGRWTFDDYYGWIWIPDYEWAPAWVEWRYDDDYIGWAPLSPYALFSVNIGIHFSTNWVTPVHHWHFVNYNYFCDPHPYRHFVDHRYRERIYHKSHYNSDYKWRNGRVYNHGIDYDRIKSKSKSKIRYRDIDRYEDYDKYSRNKNRNNSVRALNISRDRIANEDSRDIKIKNDNRRSNLKSDKVSIGRYDRQKDNRGREEKNDAALERKENRSNNDRRSDPVIRNNDGGREKQRDNERIDSKPVERQRVESQRPKAERNESNQRKQEYRESDSKREVRKEEPRKQESARTEVRQQEKRETRREGVRRPERQENKKESNTRPERGNGNEKSKSRR